MTIDIKNLVVKPSTISGAGKGLFTKVFIPKDTLIVEYVGDIATWDEVKDEYDNDYIYYINAKHVINARHRKDAIARYINDAEGIKKTRGLKNNCIYKRIGMSVWVQAVKDIQPRSELLVSYGKGYWETGRINAGIAEEERLKKQLKIK